MPKITTKSGEMMDATTSPVDKTNPDRSLPRAFFSFSLGLEDENRHNSIFL